MATYNGGSVITHIGADASDYFKAMSAVGSVTGKTMGGASSATQGATGKFSLMNTTVGKIAVGVGAVALVSKGIGVLKDSVGSAVARFDTLNAYPKVMKQMGYSTQDTNKSVSILKKGVDGLPTSLQDLTKSAQSFAILEKSATKGAKTATALNDAFLASGASAADASRGVEQYSQMLSSGSVDLQSWKTLQETMPYALTQVAKSFGLTGKSAERDLYAKLKSGDITMDQLNQRLMELDGGMNGFANTARTATGGIGTSFTNMKNAVTNGIANVISTIDSSLKNAGVVNGIAGLMNQAKALIISAFAYINQNIQVYVPIIVGAFKSMMTAMGPVFSFIGNNIDVFRSLAVGISAATAAVKIYNGTVKLVTTAMEIFNDVMAINPFTVIIVAVIAVVAALTFFFTQTKTGKAAWASFSKFMSNLWKDIVKGATDVGKNIAKFFSDSVNNVKGAWNGVGNWFSGIGKSTSNGVKSGWSSTKGFFSGIWNDIQKGGETFVKANQKMGSITAGAFKSSWNGISGFFSGIWSSIINSVTKFMAPIGEAFNQVKPLLEKAWSGLVEIASSIWGLIKDAVMGPILVLLDGLNGDWANMKQDAINTWNDIVSNVTGIWNGFVTTIVAVTQLIVGGVVAAWNFIVSTSIYIWNTVVNTIVSIWNGLVSTVTGLAVSFVNMIVNTWNAIPGFVSGLWNGIVSFLLSLWNGLISFATNFAVGTFNTVKNIWNAIPGWVSGLWNGIRSTISGVWNGIINAVVGGARGAWNGLVGAWNGAIGWVSGLWNGVKSAVKSAMNFDLWGAGQAILQSFLDGLQSVWGNVQHFVRGIATWIRDHKGPISYDRKLLIPAGAAIMGGFGSSLNANFAGVKKSVSSYAGQIADEFGQQKYVASAQLTANSTGVAGQINGGLVSLSDEVAEQSAQTPVYEIHNEMVGDKITTTVNSKNARRQATTRLVTGGI